MEFGDDVGDLVGGIDVSEITNAIYDDPQSQIRYYANGLFPTIAMV